MTKTNNFVSTAKVYPANKFAEFSTFFRIPFNDVNPSIVFGTDPDLHNKIFSAWSEVCIKALELRMNSCISMLFRNRDNVLSSNEFQIIFKKANGQIHVFYHTSFKAMEDFKEYLKRSDWQKHEPKQLWVRQLLKALYWIPEEDKQEKGGYGFSQLISFLEGFTV